MNDDKEYILTMVNPDGTKVEKTMELNPPTVRFTRSLVGTKDKQGVLIESLKLKPKPKS